MESKNIELKFKELYSTSPKLYKAPGRVNLIGEHTDYNEGFVLPAAIDKDIVYAVAENGTDDINLYSYNFETSFKGSVKDVKPSDTAWANYLLGVIAQFQKKGLEIKGFDCVFGGDMPAGAGLSSSAAVECGLAIALDDLYGHQQEKFDLVKMAQKAEHEYAGVMCGIMDQFASAFGKENHVVRLDCRSLEYRYYPFDMAGYNIVLCDTQVKHSLADSEYNTRRQECEKGVAILQKHYPEIKSLRDVTVEMIEKHAAEFDEITLKRCTYVVKENKRVEEACDSLQRGDLRSFGQYMYASHDGLQNDYEVSCPELDFLVEQTRNNPNVLGSRMMGGGFGGCTINLVRSESVESFVEKMTELYKSELGKEMKAYVTSIKDGARNIDSVEAV